MDKAIENRKKAGDLLRKTANNWHPEQIESAVKTLNSFPTESHYCAGYSAGAFVYARVATSFSLFGEGDFDNEGNAGGFFTIGFSSMNGSIFSNDFNRMIRATTKFTFSVAIPLTAVYYLDDSNTLLGYVSAASIGTFVGSGGGGCSWKKV